MVVVVVVVGVAVCGVAVAVANAAIYVDIVVSSPPPTSSSSASQQRSPRASRSNDADSARLPHLTPQPAEHGPLYLMYVWVRASCVVAHRDYSSLHACKEEEEERCLFSEREW